jgi:ribulose-bisphosphate carboxylase small chain
MRLTQGQFSFLPDLTDEQIEAQISYALSNGWAIMVEYTDDPHPRNSLWEMWAQPMFDVGEDDADVVMRDVNACREAFPHLYVKVVAYDRSLNRQTSAMSFIVNRPEHEPGFRLERQETHDRVVRYTIHSYEGLTTPHGERYGGSGEIGGLTGGKSDAKSNGKSNGKSD